MPSSNQPSKSKKILLFTTELRPGGAEKCLVNLALHLDRKQFQPQVLSIRSKPPADESRLVKLLEEANVPTHYLDCNTVWGGWQAVKRLRKLLKEHNFDLLQSFLFHANSLAGWALRSFPNTRFYAGIRVADPNRLRHRIEKRMLVNVSKIICVSKQVEDFAQNVMKLPPGRLTSIPNGIELPDTAVAKDQNSRPKHAQVVFLGRLEPQKGLVPFLNAMVQHESQLPPFDLLFVGDGSEKGQLQSISSQLRRTCHFVGWQAEPMKWIQKANVVILPSLWEGMPNSLLETMALKKPFVAFAVDGIQELGSPDNPQLVPPGHYETFLERLSRLVESPELALRLGGDNRVWVEQHFSLKKMIAEYENVYLNNPSSPN